MVSSIPPRLGVPAADTFRASASEYRAKRRRDGELLRTIDGYEGQGLTKSAKQIAPDLFVGLGELRHAD